MSGGIAVTFHGVRGSTPCAGPQYARYGGHSSCVVLEADDQPPIVFDLGTGLRRVRPHVHAATFHGTALLSHLHWDHVQGLPFFVPLHQPGATLDVYGPRQDEGPLGDVFAQMMRPPFFPIRPTDLIGDVRFHGTADDDFPVGLAKVRSRWVRHVGPTLGFRVEWNGVSVAYLPDHGPGTISDRRRRLRAARSARAVRRRRPADPRRAAHAPTSTSAKRHWGHCTVDYAVHVAREAGARKLALFHHDPVHGDDDDGRASVATRASSRRGIGRARGRRQLVKAWSCSSRRTRPGRPTSSGPMSPPGPRPLAPDAATFRTVLGHFADRRRAHHRDRRRRAGRHGVQLVHVGVARTAARVVLRGEVVDHLAPHPGRGQVGGELSRRRRRGESAGCSRRRAPTASAQIAYSPGRTGAPILDDALAFVDCETIAEHDAGDHVIVVGRVVELGYRPRAGRWSSTRAGTAACSSANAPGRLARATERPLIDRRARGESLRAASTPRSAMLRVVAATAATPAVRERDDPCDAAEGDRAGTASRRRAARRRARPGPGPSRPGPSALGGREPGRDAGPRRARWSGLPAGPSAAPRRASDRRAPGSPTATGTRTRPSSDDGDRALHGPVGADVDRSTEQARGHPTGRLGATGGDIRGGTRPTTRATEGRVGAAI